MNEVELVGIFRVPESFGADDQFDVPHEDFKLFVALTINLEEGTVEHSARLFTVVDTDDYHRMGFNDVVIAAKIEGGSVDLAWFRNDVGLAFHEQEGEDIIEVLLSLAEEAVMTSMGGTSKATTVH